MPEFIRYIFFQNVWTRDISRQAGKWLKITSVVSHLMKCQSERNCVSTTSDCIEGFEFFGRQDRTHNIVNHALVFMVRGLRRKWKQPAAYCFSCGSIKAEMIVQFLSEILDACQNAGLWYGCQQCQGLETVEFSQKETILQVS